eukprot:Nk52_evm48s2192 gene=Nk52_evmTU48s2192
MFRKTAHLGVTANSSNGITEWGMRYLRRTGLTNSAHYMEMLDVLEQYWSACKLQDMGILRDDERTAFYGLLGKLLYLIASSKNYIKRVKDLEEVYKWFSQHRNFFVKPLEVKVTCLAIGDCEDDTLQEVMKGGDYVNYNLKRKPIPRESASPSSRMPMKLPGIQGNRMSVDRRVATAPSTQKLQESLYSSRCMSRRTSRNSSRLSCENPEDFINVITNISSFDYVRSNGRGDMSTKQKENESKQRPKSRIGLNQHGEAFRVLPTSYFASKIATMGSSEGETVNKAKAGETVKAENKGFEVEKTNDIVDISNESSRSNEMQSYAVQKNRGQKKQRPRTTPLRDGRQTETFFRSQNAPKPHFFQPIIPMGTADLELVGHPDNPSVLKRMRGRKQSETIKLDGKRAHVFQNPCVAAKTDEDALKSHRFTSRLPVKHRTTVLNGRAHLDSRIGSRTIHQYAKGEGSDDPKLEEASGREVAAESKGDKSEDSVNDSKANNGAESTAAEKAQEGPDSMTEDAEKGSIGEEGATKVSENQNIPDETAPEDADSSTKSNLDNGGDEGGDQGKSGELTEGAGGEGTSGAEEAKAFQTENVEESNPALQAKTDQVEEDVQGEADGVPTEENKEPPESSSEIPEGDGVDKGENDELKE